MGTNYYARFNVCKCCGRAEEELHIGKSSGGWVFSLHVIPEKGITTLDDWKERLQKDGVTIWDEYGTQKSYEELMDVITNRGWEGHEYPYTIWGKTYNSFEELARSNDGLPGPNNLLRHNIGRLCVRHGEGTWDYLIGEFS